MEKINFKNYQLKEKNNSKLMPFQEYAIKIIDQFKINRPYQSIIWKYAKRNKCYLEGKVALCYEKFGQKVDNKGNYLISLFRKVKPWEKK
jgi:hypothetical protein